jgi:hypothetical protein
LSIGSESSTSLFRRDSAPVEHERAEWAGSPHELGDSLDEIGFAPVDLGPEAADGLAG